MSMPTPPPARMKATDDVRPLASRLPPPGRLLLRVASEGTMLHAIITTPRAISPTPRAHKAYWDPELLPPVLGEGLGEGRPLKHMSSAGACPLASEGPCLTREPERQPVGGQKGDRVAERAT